jgi:adenylosuccinate synthase
VQTGPRVVVLLSGPVAVGKTRFADELVNAYKFNKIRSGGFLAAQASARRIRADRTGLQELGDELDALTDYRWVVDSVAVPAIEGVPSQRRWLFDAVRKHRQVEHFRSEFGDAVFHVHLVAPEEVLRSRYERRLCAGSEYIGATSYDDAVKHPNEIESRSLGSIAQLTLHSVDSDVRLLAEALARATRL